jgi:hypothetical protein
MPMLYDVFYYDAATGQQAANFDRCVFLPGKGTPGEVRQCVNTNWDRHQVWLDDKGDEIPIPEWAIGDIPWLLANLDRARFTHEKYRKEVLRTLREAQNDIGAAERYRKEFKMLRKAVAAGEQITLYERANP